MTGVTDPTKRLTGVLDAVAEALGIDVAVGFARDHGGTRLWIPLKPTKAFRQLVGDDVAVVLCGYRPYELVVVPRGPHEAAAVAQRLADQALARGATIKEAVRASGLTERTIYSRKAKLRAAGITIPPNAVRRSKTP